MKFYLFFIVSICTALSSLAQNNLRLTVEWNATSSRYEVFAISQTALKNFAIGKSQISLVVPKTAPDSKLLIQNHAGGLWSDERFIVSPLSAPEQDFHGVASNGAVLNLTANQGLLLFSFTFADGNCRDGVRLFNNGSDPGSTASGFNGLDFGNSILGSASSQIYGSNVSNSGTQCKDCPVEFNLPKLKKQTD